MLESSAESKVIFFFFNATGEKLKTSGRVLSGQSVEGFPARNEMLSGFFIIEATTYEEAAAIAATCPHLKYGGRIELREIDPT